MSAGVKTYTARSDVPLDRLIACLQANSVVQVHRIRTFFPLSFLLRSSHFYMSVHGNTVRLIECPPREQDIFLFFGRGCSVIEARRTVEGSYAIKKRKSYTLVATQSVVGVMLTVFSIFAVIAYVSILASLIHIHQLDAYRATALSIGALFVGGMIWMAYLLFARLARWFDESLRNDPERWLGVVKHCLGDVPFEAA